MRSGEADNEASWPQNPHVETQDSGCCKDVNSPRLSHMSILNASLLARGVIPENVQILYGDGDCESRMYARIKEKRQLPSPSVATVQHPMIPVQYATRTVVSSQPATAMAGKPLARAVPTHPAPWAPTGLVRHLGSWFVSLADATNRCHGARNLLREQSSPYFTPAYPTEIRIEHAFSFIYRTISI